MNSCFCVDANVNDETGVSGVCLNVYCQFPLTIVWVLLFTVRWINRSFSAVLFHSRFCSLLLFYGAQLKSEKGVLSIKREVLTKY